MVKRLRVETQGDKTAFLTAGYHASRPANVQLFFNMMPWKGLVIASDINVRLYAGFGDSYNQALAMEWIGQVQILEA